jgi:hypothetical protein
MKTAKIKTTGKGIKIFGTNIKINSIHLTGYLGLDFELI